LGLSRAELLHALHDLSAEVLQQHFSILFRDSGAMRFCRIHVLGALLFEQARETLSFTIEFEYLGLGED